MKKIILSIAFCFCVLSLFETASAQVQYRTLATNKTSTMEKEMNEASAGGFRFSGVSGGSTSFGGSEVVVVLSKSAQGESSGRYQYKLLATSKTSTMQKEMQEAGDNGFEYKGQTVFSSTFGGSEVIVILEKDTKAPIIRYEYKLLATSKTSTMQKELNQVGEAGYEYVGMTVSKTLIGGSEVVVILRRLLKL